MTAEQRCLPIGPDAHARVSPDAPPELLNALAALADGRPARLRRPGRHPAGLGPDPVTAEPRPAPLDDCTGCLLPQDDLHRGDCPVGQWLDHTAARDRERSITGRDTPPASDVTR